MAQRAPRIGILAWAQPPPTPNLSGGIPNHHMQGSKCFHAKGCQKRGVRGSLKFWLQPLFPAVFACGFPSGTLHSQQIQILGSGADIISACRKENAGSFPAAEYSPLQAIVPPRLTTALSQSRRSELLQCQPTSRRCVIKGVWRNGNASDSRSEGWEFESLCPHFAFDAHHTRKSRG